MIVILLFGSASLLFALVLPEFIIHHSLSFIRLSDYLIDYYATFKLTNFFYQGGIGLWDPYAQMSNMFFFVSFGVFKFPNVLTSISYFLLAPFSHYSAQLFQQVFSVVYLLTLLFVRVLGIYLLLGTMTKKPWLLWLCTVFFSVCLSGPALIIGTDYQSFYPLMMYLILKFFTDARGRDLLRAVFLFCILLSGGVVHTCYLYLHIHFFILACLVWAGFIDPQKFQTFFKSLKKIDLRRVRNDFIIGLWAFLILAPYVYMAKFGLKDVAFSVESSRLNQVWSIGHYFNDLNLAPAPVDGFFQQMLDFTVPPGDTFFVGYMVFFLSLIGIFFWKDNRKWIFVATIASVWLLNFPRHSFSLGLIVHMINAMTNPFKTMVRAYGIAGFSILPYLFMPLVLMGIQVILEFKTKQMRWRWLGVILGMGIFVLTAMPYLAPLAKIYAVIFFLSTSAAIVFLMYKPSVDQKIKIGVLVLFFAVDACIIMSQVRGIFIPHSLKEPVLIQSQPGLGAVGIDYQNPKIQPFREHSIYQFSFEEEPLLWVPHNLTSSYFHITNDAMMYTILESHNPRHVAYKNWIHDPDMLAYVLAQDRTVFFVPGVVKASDAAFHHICTNHWQNNVGMIDAPPADSSVHSLVDIPLKKPSDEITEWKYFVKTINGSIDDKTAIIDHQTVSITYALPSDFPSWMATTIFGKDSSLLHFLLVDGNNHITEFQPAQGEIIRPHTFDVNNVREGYITAMLDVDEFTVGSKCVLAYPFSRKSGMLKVVSYDSDKLDMLYRAPERGWVILNFPYDTHWSIHVDGQPVHFYRANKSFMGLLVSAGDHRIMVEYWPHAILRFFLSLSVVLALGALGWLFYKVLVD